LMQEILITGGAGFTGANFAAAYLEKGCRVTLIDNLSRKGSRENLAHLKQLPQAEHLTVIEGDIRRPTKAFSAAVERADALFHFAAQVAVTTSVTDPRDDFEHNALGTFNMLELVRASQGKQPAFFFASTNKVYGGMEDIVIEKGDTSYYYRDFPKGIPEDRLLDFHSPYGCSKGAADQYVRDYARIYGLRTVVFRQSCIYGYRQFGIEDQGWVAWFIIAAVLGRPITIYGDGMQVRDVLFIEDLIAAYHMAWQQIDVTAGQVFNIGGGADNTMSLLELLGILRTTLNIELPVTHADWRPGDQPVYVSDIRRAESVFGWRPNTACKEGVAKLIAWVQENREMLAELF
jgi:CDP-paratose 2-epimerase